MTPSPPPAPTLEATELSTLKRKLAALEAEHGMMKVRGTKTYVWPILSVGVLLMASCSVDASQIHAGRSLHRIVDMFVAPRELVKEADRRIELLATDEDATFTAE